MYLNSVVNNKLFVLADPILAYRIPSRFSVPFLTELIGCLKGRCTEQFGDGVVTPLAEVR